MGKDDNMNSLFATWQDFVLSFGALIKIFGLWPSIRSTKKPHPRTAFIGGTVAFSFCAVYASLGTWFAFGTTFAFACCWYWLGVQSVKQYGWR